MVGIGMHGVTGSSRLRLLALAIAGAVCGHTLAYGLTFPDRMARQSVLRVAGHAYWHAAIAAAVVGALWFGAGHIARHIRAGRRGERIRSDAAASVLALAALQVAVFVGMEIVERLAVGAPLATIFEQHVLLVGLGFQVAVAAALALAAMVVGRAAEAVGARYGAAPRRASSLGDFRLPTQRSPAGLIVVPCGTRGPPSS